MVSKKVPLNQKGIGTLPNDKPVVYEILTEGGRINYVGVAQPGRVRERLKEHIADGKDYVPGAEVKIQPAASIEDARAKESAIISREKPPYNERGK